MHQMPEVSVWGHRRPAGLQPEHVLTGKHDAEIVPGSTERVRAKFLAGCDGGRSIVRTELGIDMSGTSFPERWLVVDLKAREGVDAFRHLPYFDFVCDPELPIVSCPQPDGHHRSPKPALTTAGTSDSTTRSASVSPSWVTGPTHAAPSPPPTWTFCAPSTPAS